MICLVNFFDTYFEILPIEIVQKIFMHYWWNEMRMKQHNFELQFKRESKSTWNWNENYERVYLLSRKLIQVREVLRGGQKTVYFQKSRPYCWHRYLQKPDKESRIYPPFR